MVTALRSCDTGVFEEFRADKALALSAITGAEVLDPSIMDDNEVLVRRFMLEDKEVLQAFQDVIGVSWQQLYISRQPRGVCWCLLRLSSKRLIDRGVLHAGSRHVCAIL